MKISLLKSNTNINSALIDSVIEQFGGKESFKESASDVSNNGINGGFGGFIYHNETVKFAQDNKALIMEMAEEQAQDFGNDGALSMIAGFNCLNNEYNQSDIAAAIYSDSDDSTQVLNALAWYAAEEVCRAYADLKEYA
tara:strand:+ start:63 stop:479 length:417 start_codon:yes stop_codon:yes gene_type:complete